MSSQIPFTSPGAPSWLSMIDATALLFHLHTGNRYRRRKGLYWVGPMGDIARESRNRNDNSVTTPKGRGP